MLSKLLTAALVLTLVGCESKEYKKDSNPGVDYAKMLNDGDNKGLIRALDNKPDISSRQQYYLASAYSGAGGIDVFSLYAVLELQLFRKNALEWSDLSKEQNPYLKFMKSQGTVDVDARRKKREAKWDRSYPQLVEQNGWHLVRPDDIGSLYWDWEKEYKEVIKMPADAAKRTEAWNVVADKANDALAEKGLYWSDLDYATFKYFQQQIDIETKKENYISPETKTDAVFGNVQWEMVYMNVLWNTYEAIPMLKKLPTLNSEEQENITKALSEYRKLLKTDKFREVSLKNMMVLAGVSMLSIYKESFDLEDVAGMQDLICNFEPRVLTDHYELIRNRLIFVAEVMKENNQMSGKLKEYEGKIDQLKEIIPERLTEEQKKSYIEGYDEFKIKQCYK